MLLFCQLLVRSDLSVSQLIAYLFRRKVAKIQWQTSCSAERMANGKKIKQTKNLLLIKQQVAVRRDNCVAILCLHRVITWLIALTVIRCSQSRLNIPRIIRMIRNELDSTKKKAKHEVSKSTPTGRDKPINVIFNASVYLKSKMKRKK